MGVSAKWSASSTLWSGRKNFFPHSLLPPTRPLPQRIQITLTGHQGLVNDDFASTSINQLSFIRAHTCLILMLLAGVWSPGQKQEPRPEEPRRSQSEVKNEPLSPVWTPKSATSSPTVERKEFRPVKFESPVLSRKSSRVEVRGQFGVVVV